jgi:hypothetical protein
LLRSRALGLLRLRDLVVVVADDAEEFPGAGVFGPDIGEARGGVEVLGAIGIFGVEALGS